MKINLIKNPDLDSYRGVNPKKDIKIVGWEILKPKDLSYFLYSVVKPMSIAHSVSIILK